MKKTLLIQLVRQEVRRTLKPTGLMGVRGPAKSVPVLVRNHFAEHSKGKCRPDTNKFYEVGGSR